MTDWKDTLRTLKGKLGPSRKASNGADEFGRKEPMRTGSDVPILRPGEPLPFGKRVKPPSRASAGPIVPPVQPTATGTKKEQAAPPAPSQTDDGPTKATPAQVDDRERAALAFRPRIERTRPLAMPDWAPDGRQLQHPKASGRLKSTPVRLGVDLGTAFTKVAIRVGHRMTPVDWSPVTGDLSEVGRFILPGLVSRSPDGVFGWGHAECAVT